MRECGRSAALIGKLVSQALFKGGWIAQTSFFIHSAPNHLTLQIAVPKAVKSMRSENSCHVAKPVILHRPHECAKTAGNVRSKGGHEWRMA